MKTFIEYLEEAKVFPASLLTQETKDKIMSKEDAAKMHEVKNRDRSHANIMAEFQNGGNAKVNRAMRTAKVTQAHGAIISAFQSVIGRNKTGFATSHPGTIFHGQTHAPEIKNGVVEHKGFTSWSTNPATAMQFVKGKGDAKGSATSHHMYMMDHDPENAAGHSLYSLNSPEHSSARFREDELVGGPVKYKVNKIVQIENHPVTKLPMTEYHVSPLATHPNWNSKAPKWDAKEVKKELEEYNKK